MAFTQKQAGPMADINVTPLVDVMLVLLIIFMITAPILAHQVQIDLPQKTTAPPTQIDPPPPIALRIRATGELYWNDQPMIRADEDTEFKDVATMMASAKTAGMKKVGLITTPR